MMVSIKKIFLLGLQLMIPLFLAVFVLQKIFELLFDFLKPIIDLLPESHILGYELLDLRALIAFIISVFICGFVMRIGFGQYILRLINFIVMKIVPGHSVFENMISEEAASGDTNYRSVVFACIDEVWAMGLVIEEKNEFGLLMIYIPTAPIPTGGNLYMMKEEQLKRVNISVQDALKCIWHLGKDSDKIFAGKVKW
jgi:uncharacterized membrane protein